MKIFKTISGWVSSLLLPEPFIESGTELTGKVIIITGASRGIGLATAKLLSKKGAKVVLISRKIIENNLRDTISLSADITSESDCASVIEKCLETFGRVDVLINNAGTFIDKRIDKITSGEFKKILDTNILGTFNMTRFCLPFMKKQKSGLIINIGSKISHNTNVSSGKVAYATSKYAIEGFSFSLNKELKGSGVRAVCLMPGTVSTFLSKQSKNYLSPYDVASMIKTIIVFKNIDFESVIFKSIKQNI